MGNKHYGHHVCFGWKSVNTKAETEAYSESTQVGRIRPRGLALKSWSFLTSPKGIDLSTMHGEGCGCTGECLSQQYRAWVPAPAQSAVVAGTLGPALERRRQAEPPGTCLPTRLAKLVSSRSWHSVSKDNRGRCTKVNHMCMCIHLPYMYTNIQFTPPPKKGETSFVVWLLWHLYSGDTLLLPKALTNPNKRHIWTQGLNGTSQRRQLWNILFSALKQSSDFSICHQYKLRNWA